MREIKAFACSFCGFISRVKGSAKAHEKRCYYNPVNRACASCSTNGWCVLQKEKLRSNCDAWVNWSYEEISEDVEDA